MLLVVTALSIYVEARDEKITEKVVDLLDVHEATISFAMDSVIISFSPKDLSHYCAEELKANPQLDHAKTLSSLLKKTGNTVIQIREHPKSKYTEGLYWASVKLLELGKAKVFDTRRKVFTKQIIVKKTQTSGHGEIGFFYSDGSLIFSALLWIE